MNISPDDLKRACIKAIRTHWDGIESGYWRRILIVLYGRHVTRDWYKKQRLLAHAAPVEEK